MRERESGENKIDSSFEGNFLLMRSRENIFDALKLADVDIGGQKVSSSLLSSYLRYPSKDNVKSLQALFGYPQNGDLDKELLDAIMDVCKKQLVSGVAMDEWKKTISIPRYNSDFTLQNRGIIVQYLSEWKSLESTFDHDTYSFYAQAAPTLVNVMKLQEKLGLKRENQDGYFGPITLHLLQEKVEKLKNENIGKVLAQKEFTKLRGSLRIEDYDFYIQSAKKCVKAGEIREFYKDLEEAMKLDNKNPEPYILRGNHYKKR